MTASKSPLSGYNHNLKYKGRVYHVQTEDSGWDSPHIFTHLFHDGTILSTQKQDYGDLEGNETWEEELRTRMQAQHKDMMKGLIRGMHDDHIVAFFGVLESEEAEELPMATLPPPPTRAERGTAAPPAAPEKPAPPAQPAAPAQHAGVVVSMPMMIIGDNSAGQPGAAPFQQPTGPHPQFKPEESKAVPDSIFGSDLISEKSLDEVILAYLSEDLSDD